MNSFKRKSWAALAAALLISGCASTPPAAPAPDPREAIAATVAACAASIERVATSAGGDTASRIVAVGSIERMCGGQGTAQLAALNSGPPPQPQSLGQTLFTAALQVGDLFVRGYGLKLSRDVGIVQSNNQAATAIASYGSFATLGSYVRDAGIAGYPFVQAPGATTTTTNTSTLSGTGVLGSGTYTGPVATTRTCNGGQAGNGAGTTTGAPGGAGGTASC